MKTVKALFAAGLIVVGLSFTACSNDDKYIAPEVENPIERAPIDNPIERPEIENPVVD